MNNTNDNNYDVFKGVGVEIELDDYDDFLMIMETLTRIGISSKKEKTLNQSCHILHKKGRYAILHFKELFMLDNRETNFTAEDKARRNRIVNLLEQWGLLTIISNEDISEMIPVSNIKIIPAKEKRDWNLVSKYTIGKKHNY